MIGDKEISYDVKLKQSKRMRISLSFDSARVNELQAVQFLHKLQTNLSDPDMLLL